MPPAIPSARLLDTANRLHRSTVRLTRRLRSTRPAGSLGLSRFGILARLREAGPSSARGISDYLGLQPQSLTRLVSSLESAGLIRRETDPHDGRAVRLEITTAGMRLFTSDLEQRRLRLAQAIAAVLTSAEQRALRAAADLIERTANAVGPTPPAEGGHP